ncbi:UpxY family transcription antiterminator [Desulfosoma caldarium]|nr:UpxY family transcription antiterminator [Desulfosoma caldarium]
MLRDKMDASAKKNPAPVAIGHDDRLLSQENAPGWYALYVQVNHEKKVADQLLKKNIECFLPLMPTWSKRRDRRVRLQVPLFPGYVFVHTVLDNEVHVEILKIPGSVYVVRNSQGPALISDYQVESLRTVLTHADTLTLHPYLTAGDWVEVVRGPFAGCVGILQRLNPKKGTLVISIDVIRQAASVQLAIEDVVRIDGPPDRRRDLRSGP